MAENLYTAAKWRRNYSKPGTRILYSSHNTLHNSFMEGSFWNGDPAHSTTAPSAFPLRDITGAPTCLGLKTNQAFAGRTNNASDPADDLGYPFAAIKSPHYDSGTAEIEIYGIPENSVCDLVLYGIRRTSGTFGGTYRIKENNLMAEVINANTGTTGAIKFPSFKCDNGSVTIEFIKTDGFVYWNMFDLLVYEEDEPYLFPAIGGAAPTYIKPPYYEMLMAS